MSAIVEQLERLLLEPDHQRDLDTLAAAPFALEGCPMTKGTQPSKSRRCVDPRFRRAHRHHAGKPAAISSSESAAFAIAAIHHPRVKPRAQPPYAPPRASSKARPTVAALLLVVLSGAVAEAAETATVTARAGAARIAPGKPSGPTPMVKRGLLLPAGMVDVYTQPNIERPVGVDTFRMAPTLGALWGIIPELQADFQLTPVYLPSLARGSGRIAVTGQFVKTRPVDVGIGLTTLFDPSAPRYIGYIQPSVGAIFRLNEHLRIDTALQLPAYTTADPHFGFRIPVSIYFQITDRIHFGSTSALFIADLRDSQKTASVPFGLTFGYSAGPELYFAAFTPYVSWTNFYSFASGKVDTRAVVGGLIADVAFELP